VFRVKENPKSTVNRHRPHLVAKGFNQQFGSDYTETFSPVSKPVTVRLILTLANTHGWPLKQLDFNNAFLNEILEEKVYMTSLLALNLMTSLSCADHTRRSMG